MHKSTDDVASSSPKEIDMSFELHMCATLPGRTVYAHGFAGILGPAVNEFVRNAPNDNSATPPKRE